MPKRKILTLDWDKAFTDAVCRAAFHCDLEIRLAEELTGFADLYRSYRPDLVAYPLFSHEIEGIEITRWIDGQDHQASVLMTTEHDIVYARASEVLAADERPIEVAITPRPGDDAELHLAIITIMGSTNGDKDGALNA